MLSNLTVRIDPAFKDELLDFSKLQGFSSVSDFIRYTLYGLVGFIPTKGPGVISDSKPKRKKEESKEVSKKEWEDLL